MSLACCRTTERIVTSLFFTHTSFCCAYCARRVASAAATVNCMSLLRQHRQRIRVAGAFIRITFTSSNCVGKCNRIYTAYYLVLIQCNEFKPVLCDCKRALVEAGNSILPFKLIIPYVFVYLCILRGIVARLVSNFCNNISYDSDFVDVKG